MTKLLMGAGVVDATTYVEDVFSTYLYEGNGSTQDIVNGIDLAGEGGMVWIKSRSVATSSVITDTERGASQFLQSNNTTANVDATGKSLSAFNTTGFSIDETGGYWVGGLAATYASWTFRKAPRFFDVVKYTGNGVAGSRLLNHDLGVAPGLFFLKATSASGNWWTYHRSIGEDNYLVLNSTAGSAPFVGFTAVTDTTIDVEQFNTLGQEHIIYLFAHDTEDDGMIQCGVVTVSGGVADVDLGWEAQWLLTKPTFSGAWWMTDDMRGFSLAQSKLLQPHSSSAEYSDGSVYYTPTSTGFKMANWGNGEYIYMAIRRPMKTPEVGTEVFAISERTATAPGFDSGFPVDAAIRRVVSSIQSNSMTSRLTGSTSLKTDTAYSEVPDLSTQWDYMEGYSDDYGSGSNFYSWMFKRAPGFFDVVAYTGTGVAHAESHGLGVVPELMIVKARSLVGEHWGVYYGDNTKYLQLDDNIAPLTLSSIWNNTSPTDTGFTIGTSNIVNGSPVTYITYLFATCPGVSKVGSYTGNGSSQTINCGFSTGARFILIKRTDSTGDWFVWDSVRGIVAANDPHLSLNTTAAEVTTDDSVDPEASGFIVNQVAATNINVTSAEYIFYAIS